MSVFYPHKESALSFETVKATTTAGGAVAGDKFQWHAKLGNKLVAVGYEYFDTREEAGAAAKKFVKEIRGE